MTRALRWATILALLGGLAPVTSSAHASDRARTTIRQHLNACGNPDPTAADVGSVTFTRDGQTVAARIKIQGALPNEDYALWLTAQPGCTDLKTGSLRTDDRGTGKTTLVGTAGPAHTHFQVTVRWVNALTFFGQTGLVELRP